MPTGGEKWETQQLQYDTRGYDSGKVTLNKRKPLSVKCRKLLFSHFSEALAKFKEKHTKVVEFPVTNVDLTIPYNWSTWSTNLSLIVKKTRRVTFFGWMVFSLHRFRMHRRLNPHRCVYCFRMNKYSERE